MKEFRRNLRSEISPHLKRHILKMVLVRLDFAPLFSFDNIAGAAQKQFLIKYPQSSIEEEVGFDVDIKNKSAPTISVRESNRTSVMGNPEQKKKLKLNQKALILEHHQYDNFGTFFDEFISAAQFVFTQSNAVYSPVRLGLRKISTLVLPEIESIEKFSELYNSAVTQHLSIPFLSRTLRTDKHFLSFTLENDDLGVNFQFSTEKGRKGDDDARRFILDIDIFSTSLDRDLKKLPDVLKKMNEVGFDLFWWSTGPRLERYLRGEIENP